MSGENVILKGRNGLKSVTVLARERIAQRRKRLMRLNRFGRRPHKIPAIIRNNMPALTTMLNSEEWSEELLSGISETDACTMYHASVLPKESNLQEKADSGDCCWTSVGTEMIPCVYRGVTPFVSVKVVEDKVLKKFPNFYPDDILQEKPLESYFMTAEEAVAFTKTTHNYEFTCKDVIVNLVSFNSFFDKLVHAFATLDEQKCNELSRKPKTRCGWIRINNSIVPFVTRDKFKLMPLDVLQYASRLLTDVDPAIYRLTTEECIQLNRSCIDAYIVYTFTEESPMVNMGELLRCKSQITRFRILPNAPSKELLMNMAMALYKFKPIHSITDVTPDKSSASSDGQRPRCSSADVIIVDNPCYYRRCNSASDGATSSRRIKIHSTSTYSTSPIRQLSKGSTTSTIGAQANLRQLSNCSGTQMSTRLPPIRQFSNSSTTSAHVDALEKFSDRVVNSRSSSISDVESVTSVRSALLSPSAIRPPAENSSSSRPTAASPTIIRPSPASSGCQSAASRDGFLSPISSASGRNSRCSSAASARDGMMSPISSASGRGSSAGSVNFSFDEEIQLSSDGLKVVKRFLSKPSIIVKDILGQKISVLERNDNRSGDYLLLETTQVIFFTAYTLTDMIRVLRDYLHIRLSRLERDEELAFIEFYELSVENLHCDYIIKVRDFVEAFHNLKANLFLMSQKSSKQS